MPSSVIRLAERQAARDGKTYMIIKLCSGYDFINEDAYKKQKRKAIYTVVPNDSRPPDVELGTGEKDK